MYASNDTHTEPAELQSNLSELHLERALQLEWELRNEEWGMGTGDWTG